MFDFLVVDAFLGVCFFSPKTFSTQSSRLSRCFFWRLSTEQFLVPENISNIKISWKKKQVPPQKKLTWNPKLGGLEMFLLLQGVFSGSMLVNSFLAQYFLFGRIQDPFALRNTFFQINTANFATGETPKKAGNVEKNARNGSPERNIRSAYPRYQFYSLNPIHACELCFHPRWTSMSAP